jgi:hypothetical protein
LEKNTNSPQKKRCGPTPDGIGKSVNRKTREEAERQDKKKKKSGWMVEGRCKK